MSTKLESGAMFPQLTVPCAGGRTIRLGGARRGWQLIVVYRGRHCPICSRYLAKLDGMAKRFAELDTEIIAVSADPCDRAEQAKTEWAIGFDIAYDLSLDAMRALGLYISAPADGAPHPFPEPALFAVNPEGRAQIIEIANAPFVRPDLETILSGLAFIREKNYPIRGTMA
jgi:peroxiredoxin